VGVVAQIAKQIVRRRRQVGGRRTGGCGDRRAELPRDSARCCRDARAVARFILEVRRQTRELTCVVRPPAGSAMLGVGRRHGARP